MLKLIYFDFNKEEAILTEEKTTEIERRHIMESNQYKIIIEMFIYFIAI
jgi:hypothetical protein